MHIPLLSTRGDTREYTFSEAVLEGQGMDGGLLVPSLIPTFSLSEIALLRDLSYAQVVQAIVKKLGIDFDDATVRRITEEAYQDFDTPLVAPVKKLTGGLYQMELWHGPTAAFKDMALQMMPRFFVEAMRRRGGDQRYLVLAATSGDTGSAALAGYRDLPGVGVMAFFPEGGVSEIQALQMTGMQGRNIRAQSAHGDFDAIQGLVKYLFADAALKGRLQEKRVTLTSANSINWGRLVPQMCYYFWGYVQLLKKGVLALGDTLDIAVPSGNFGNILGGYFAGKMGLPLGTFVSASNSNDALVTFLRTGVYDISTKMLVRTPSPSMDILISNNIERLLWLLTGNTAKIAAYMRQLKEFGKYEVDDAVKKKLKEQFAAYTVDNAGTYAAIKAAYKETGTVLCPHTAVGYAAAQEYRSEKGAKRPMLLMATAHFGKFPAHTLAALTGKSYGSELMPDPFRALAAIVKKTGAEVPASITDLEEALPVRRPVLTPDQAAFEGAVMDMLTGKW